MLPADTRLFKITGYHDKQGVVTEINSLDTEHPWHIEISLKPTKRSVAQNALLWAYNTAIGKQMIPPQDKDDVHLWLRFKILGTSPREIMGTAFNKIPETKNLTVKQMQEYLLEIEALALTAGYDLPAPNFREEAIR